MLAEDGGSGAVQEDLGSSNLEDLTPDLLLSVFRHLDASSLVNVSATCQQWRSLASTDALWEQAWQVCEAGRPNRG
jgi:hypothetical protein